MGRKVGRLGHWMLGVSQNLPWKKRSGPGQVLAGWAQALRMCESEPHPPAPAADSLLPPALGSRAGEIMPLSKPFKVKDSFINKFSLPSKLSPQNKYSPPFGGGGDSVLGPAPLEGQPPSVSNRSLTPQTETPWWNFRTSEWVGPNDVWPSGPWAMGAEGGTLCANAAVP